MHLPRDLYGRSPLALCVAFLGVIEGSSDAKGVRIGTDALSSFLGDPMRSAAQLAEDRMS